MNQPLIKPLRIGIDASNIRMGGGITHLLELLDAIDPKSMGVEQVCVWASSNTLESLPNHSWIKKCNPPSLNVGLFKRTWWQIRFLSMAAKNEACDVLLVPGGSYVGSFHPVVTMSQNLFPFEWSAIAPNGLRMRSLKFILLRLIQSSSFKRSDGVIFLTQYAKEAVFKVTGVLAGLTAIIAHGLNPRFDYRPKPQLPIQSYDEFHPYRLLYVSIIDTHKHQDQVIRAVEQLRRKGYPLSLTLVGPQESMAYQQMQDLVHGLPQPTDWLQYLGPISYHTLEQEYQQADLGIFASTCETFGMIVLEKMSVGLPLACAWQSSMQETLQDGGVYFDALNPHSIADAIEQYLLSPQLREQKIERAHQLAAQYTWQNCASQTLAFLHQVVRNRVVPKSP